MTFDDIPKHYLEEVKHFFMIYKTLEGATVENKGWVGTEESRETVTQSLQMYRDKFPPRGAEI